MNELKVIIRDNIEVVDSRSVAQMVARNHKDLLRDIRGYIEVMNNSTEISQRNFAPSDFFIESSFENRGKEYPCYLLTKKGCDMVANKMTGEKGVLFTAAYVTAFEKMEGQLKDRGTRSYPPRPMTKYQEANIALQKDKLAFKRATVLLQLADKYDGTYKQVLHAHATKEMTGEFLLPLPALVEKTYSAQEVGDILGISANLVGRLANKHGLKDDAHGRWFKDKAKYSDKEVSSFRYYQSAVDEIRQVIMRGSNPPDGMD